MKIFDTTPYHFTGKIKYFYKHILKEIQLVGGIHSGWIESEENLSLEKSAVVLDNAMVYGNAYVKDDASVYGTNTTVCDNALVYGSARIFGGSRVSGKASVKGDAIVEDQSEVFANAIITGNARILGHARIGKDAFIKDTNDYFVIGPIGRRYDFTTFYKGTSSIMVCCGCFNDTIEEFSKRVENVHKGNEFGKTYRTAILCANKILA